MTKEEMTDEQFIIALSNTMTQSRKEYYKGMWGVGEGMLAMFEKQLEKQKEIANESKGHQ